eukprot:3651665-Amphidinium_carterae.1
MSSRSGGVSGLTPIRLPPAPRQRTAGTVPARDLTCATTTSSCCWRGAAGTATTSGGAAGTALT